MTGRWYYSTISSFGTDLISKGFQYRTRNLGNKHVHVYYSEMFELQIMIFTTYFDTGILRWHVQKKGKKNSYTGRRLKDLGYFMLKKYKLSVDKARFVLSEFF